MALRLPRALLPVLVLVAALILPASAGAAAWAAPATVTENPAHANALPNPQVAVDGQGNAVLAMATDKGPPKLIQVATRTAGAAAWSAAQELGPANNSGGGPSLAVDPAGNAVVVFADSATTTSPCVSGTGCLHVWAKPAGSSTWTNEKLMSAPASTGFLDPAVALDPRGTGDAMIIWHRTPSVGQAIVESMARSSGVWGSVQTVLSTSEIVSNTRVAIDAAGTPIAVWAATTSGCTTTCTYSLRTGTYVGTRGWAKTTVTTSTTGQYDAGRQDVFEALDGQGTVSAIWLRSDPSTGNTTAVEMATHPATTTAPWGAVANVNTPAANDMLAGPQLRIASDGEAVAGWGRVNGAGVSSAEAAVRPAGGSFGVPQILDPSTNASTGPALVMDGAGNATAVWRNTVSATQRFAVQTHGGAFGSSADFTSGGSSAPVAAADPAGHVAAAWAASTSTVDTKVYDPVPPTLGPFTPFSGVLVGALLSFSDSASDLWSPPATLHWDFGDGSGADGSSVTHSYASAGAKPATVTATDASGNSTGAADTIDVAQQAPPPPPPPALDKPVANKTFNIAPVGNGPVLVEEPGSKKFVPLTKPSQVRNGSIIDARKGRVQITIDNGRGGFDTADFFEGGFRFDQPKVKPGQRAFANLYLVFGSFKGCPKAPKNPKIAALARSKKSAGRSVRHLWGQGTGAFRTVGRYSSATVRGTTWETDDRCNGTLTKVRAGKVGVRDFVLRKTIVVKKGKSYFAKPR